MREALRERPAQGVKYKGGEEAMRNHKAFNNGLPLLYILTNKHAIDNNKIKNREEIEQS